jgi:hypothetical protein
MSFCQPIEGRSDPWYVFTLVPGSRSHLMPHGARLTLVVENGGIRGPASSRSGRRSRRGQSAMRPERAQRVRQSNCVRFHEPSPTIPAPHPRPGRNLIKIEL